MKLFGSRDRGIDWASVAIAPDPKWLRHLEYPQPPSLMEVAKEAVAKSGRRPEAVDSAAVVQMVLRLFVGQANAYFQGLKIEKGPSDMDAIIRRPDFQSEMLWSYLTHHGGRGVAMHNNLVKLLTSESTQQTLVGLIQEGQADVGQTAGTAD